MYDYKREILFCKDHHKLKPANFLIFFLFKIKSSKLYIKMQATTVKQKYKILFLNYFKLKIIDFISIFKLLFVFLLVVAAALAVGPAVGGGVHGGGMPMMSDAERRDARYWGYYWG